MERPLRPGRARGWVLVAAVSLVALALPSWQLDTGGSVADEVPAGCIDRAMAVLESRFRTCFNTSSQAAPHYPTVLGDILDRCLNNYSVPMTFNILAPNLTITNLLQATNYSAVFGDTTQHRINFSMTQLPVWGRTEALIGGVDPVKLGLPPGTTASAADYHAYLVDPVALADLFESKLTLDLSQIILHQQYRDQIDWFGIHRLFRGSVVVGDGKVSAVPFGGLVYQMFYRSDVLAAANQPVPITWDDFLAVAAKVNGTDMNGDGIGDFGVCLQRPRFCFGGFNLAAILSSFVQSHGTRQGGFFDPDTMEPLVNNEAMREALELYVALRAYGPPDETTAPCLPFNMQFVRGRCALTLNWSYQLKANTFLPFSYVRNRTSSALLPGSTRVLDRASRGLVRCADRTICPMATESVQVQVQVPVPDGNATSGNATTTTTSMSLLVNRAPFLALATVSAAISTTATVDQQAHMMALIAYLSSKNVSWNLVTSARTEFAPYRFEHFDPSFIGEWVKRGYNSAVIGEFLAVMKQQVDSDNVMLEMRTVEAYVYRRVFDIYATAVSNREISVGEAMAAMERELLQTYGPSNPRYETIRRLYRYSIGDIDLPAAAVWAPPPPPEHRPSSAAAHAPIIVAAAVSAAVLVGGVVLGALLMRRYAGALLRKHAGPVEHPKLGPGTTLVVTDVEGSTALWEVLEPSLMDDVFNVHHSCMRHAALRWRGYESQTEGDSFIICFHSAEDAVSFCLDAQQALLEAPWPMALLARDACRPVWMASTGAELPLELPDVAYQLQGAGGAAAAGHAHLNNASGPSTTLGGASIKAVKSGASLGSGPGPGPSRSSSALLRIVSWAQQHSAPSRRQHSFAPMDSFHWAMGSMTGGDRGAASPGAYGVLNSPRACTSGRPSFNGADALLAGAAGQGGAGAGGPPLERMLDALRLMWREVSTPATATFGLSAFLAQSGFSPTLEQGPAVSAPPAVHAGAAAESTAEALGEHANAGGATSLSATPLGPDRMMSHRSQRGPMGLSSSPRFGMAGSPVTSPRPSFLQHHRLALGAGDSSGLAAAAAAAGGSVTLVGTPPAAVAASHLHLRYGSGGYAGASPLAFGSAGGGRDRDPGGGLPGADRGEGLQLVARGLKVRMGAHSGLHHTTDLVYSEVAARWKYSGQILAAAKAVSDAANGGQVLLSPTTVEQLGPDFKSKRVLLCFAGRYKLQGGDSGGERSSANNPGAAGVAGGSAPLALAPGAPTDLWLVTNARLLPRLALHRPLRTAAMLGLGALDAPVGMLAYAHVTVMGLSELAMQCPGSDVLLEALEALDLITRDQAAACSGVVVPGTPTGVVAGAFKNPYHAILWVLQCQEDLYTHPWSAELLAQEQFEVIVAPTHMAAASAAAAAAGKRVRTPSNPGGAERPASSERQPLPPPQQPLQRSAGPPSGGVAQAQQSDASGPRLFNFVNNNGSSGLLSTHAGRGPAQQPYQQGGEGAGSGPLALPAALPTTPRSTQRSGMGASGGSRPDILDIQIHEIQAAEPVPEDDGMTDGLEQQHQQALSPHHLPLSRLQQLRCGSLAGDSGRDAAAGAREGAAAQGKEVVLFRGPRIKGAITFGPVKASLDPASGRLRYEGKPVGQAQKLSAYSSTGMVVASVEAVAHGNVEDRAGDATGAAAAVPQEDFAHCHDAEVFPGAPHVIDLADVEDAQQHQDHEQRATQAALAGSAFAHGGVVGMAGPISSASACMLSGSHVLPGQQQQPSSSPMHRLLSQLTGSSARNSQSRGGSGNGSGGEQPLRAGAAAATGEPLTQQQQHCAPEPSAASMSDAQLQPLPLPPPGSLVRLGSIDSLLLRRRGPLPNRGPSILKRQQQQAGSGGASLQQLAPDARQNSSHQLPQMVSRTNSAARLLSNLNPASRQGSRTLQERPCMSTLLPHLASAGSTPPAAAAAALLGKPAPYGGGATGSPMAAGRRLSTGSSSATSLASIPADAPLQGGMATVMAPLSAMLLDEEDGQQQDGAAGQARSAKSAGNFRQLLPLLQPPNGPLALIRTRSTASAAAAAAPVPELTSGNSDAAPVSLAHLPSGPLVRTRSNDSHAAPGASGSAAAAVGSVPLALLAARGSASRLQGSAPVTPTLASLPPRAPHPHPQAQALEGAKPHTPPSSGRLHVLDLNGTLPREMPGWGPPAEPPTDTAAFVLAAAPGRHATQPPSTTMSGGTLLSATGLQADADADTDRSSWQSGWWAASSNPLFGQQRTSPAGGYALTAPHPLAAAAAGSGPHARLRAEGSPPPPFGGGSVGRQGAAHRAATISGEISPYGRHRPDGRGAVAGGTHGGGVSTSASEIRAATMSGGMDALPESHTNGMYGLQPLQPLQPRIAGMDQKSLPASPVYPLRAPSGHAGQFAGAAAQPHQAHNNGYSTSQQLHIHSSTLLEMVGFDEVSMVPIALRKRKNSQPLLVYLCRFASSDELAQLQQNLLQLKTAMAAGKRKKISFKSTLTGAGPAPGAAVAPGAAAVGAATAPAAGTGSGQRRPSHCGSAISEVDASGMHSGGAHTVGAAHAATDPAAGSGAVPAGGAALAHGAAHLGGQSVGSRLNLLNRLRRSSVDGLPAVLAAAGRGGGGGGSSSKAGRASAGNGWSNGATPMHLAEARTVSVRRVQRSQPSAVMVMQLQQGSSSGAAGMPMHMSFRQQHHPASSSAQSFVAPRVHIFGAGGPASGTTSHVAGGGPAAPAMAWPPAAAHAQAQQNGSSGALPGVSSSPSFGRKSVQ